jgi:hypothetical protein
MWIFCPGHAGVQGNEIAQTGWFERTSGSVTNGVSQISLMPFWTVCAKKMNQKGKKMCMLEGWWK